MRRVVIVLLAVAVVGFGVYTVRRMAAADRLAEELQHAITEIRGEMEYQACRLADRDVRREEMRRNAETLHYPPEIARLRAEQRKADRVGLAEIMFALPELRAAYDSVWTDFYTGNKWSVPSGGTAAPSPISPPGPPRPSIVSLKGNAK